MTKVNPVSFGGVRKVTTFVLPVSKNKKLTEVSAVIQDGFVKSSDKKQAGSPLLKVTQFFAKNDKLVGNHIEYPNGNYQGTRTFANGLQMSYSATKLSDDFYVAGTTLKSPKQGLISAHIAHDAYDKEGKPFIFTLKQIQKMMNESKSARELCEEELAKL
ncbi:hypothetical protein J6Q66_04140 [bacterium]|nr:hypothetical protein [bacterium]